MSAQQWNKLLLKQRIGVEKSSDDDFRSPFQRDIDRIIFSSSFRRLQDKTQVFPLARNDYIRTRLTHSMEVSCVGRSLGLLVGRELNKRYKLSVDANGISEIVSAACLAHDIGNPPFGHAGEDTIRHWFLDPQRGMKYLKNLKEEEAEEFINFEGNAQGFRVLTRLQRHTRDDNTMGGLQLTFATLGTFLKYPRPAKLNGPSGMRRSQKKYNYFITEKDQFKKVVDTLQLDSFQTNCYQRHPLVFLMEAADDISYNIADMQDGYRLGLVSYDEVFDFFKMVLGNNKVNIVNEILRLTDRRDRIETLGGKAIGSLVREAANAFLENEKAILDGSFDESLMDVIPSNDCINSISSFAYENIYSSEPVIEVKVGGFEVVQGLLDLFVPAVFDGSDRTHYDFKRLELVLRLIPKQFMGKLQKPHENPYIRLHQILDFVSGMTDSYALALYRKLYGLNL